MDSSRDDDGAWKQGDSGVSFPELLNFASRAQSLISEVLLLSGRIPNEFRDRRYDPVLFDLRYFDSPDEFESRIVGNAELEELEDQLRESCSEFMHRFFLLANGIVIYHQGLLKYLDEIQEGAYPQSALERVIENEKGRQLLTESLALFGCILLLLEHHMGGFLREKLLVAHVRYDCCFNAPNIQQICLLSRMHPLKPVRHRQIHYSPSSSTMVLVQNPEELLMKFPFPKQVVDSIISLLRDCDLYNRVRHYPDPEHRTVALSSQAGWLYVLLFYSPEFLHNGIVMREIVDRFFKDSWVVPLFMYFIVDLSLSWDAYKAAKTSLSLCLSSSFIRDLCHLHCAKVKDLMSELSSLLSDGVLSRGYVLNNFQSLLSFVRNCNVSFRWLLLHLSSNDKKVREIVISLGTAHQLEEDTPLLFLLNISRFEFEVKELYTELLEDKGALWKESANHASTVMQELSEYFSGAWASLWKMEGESLKDWFKNLSLEVKENLQIKQHILGIQKYLQDMLQALNLHHDALSTFSVITDAVFAWGFIEDFTKQLHKKIQQDPFIVLNLHSFFLKFQSLLHAPLVRISENCSPDETVVSAYYSLEYVEHICAILEIIPVMLFRILDDSVTFTVQPFHQLNRIERDNLQDFMQVDQQFHLTETFNQISIYSQGILAMSRNLHNLIHLDVKSWIEGKMQEGLFKQFGSRLNSFFMSPSVGLEELEMKMKKLTTNILSQLHLMECFQDLIHSRVTHIWEEAYAQFLRYCVQIECDNYSSQRNPESMVACVQVDSNAQTFLGQILHQIIKQTNPSSSMYLEPMSGWFDAAGNELLGLRFFDILESCIGPLGMASLDSVLAFVILKKLEHALKILRSLLDARCLGELRMLDSALGPPSSLPLLRWSSYKKMAKFVETLWEPWVESLACIGQLQILRCLITLKLKSACKVKASLISSAVGSMIASVSSQREKLKGIKKENDGMGELFLHELSKQGMLCGFCLPLQSLYISEDPPDFLSRCAFVVTISQLPRYILDTHLNTLTSRMKKVSLDFSPLAIGLGTFLRQFHPSYLIQYAQYMGQYVRITAEDAFGVTNESQKRSTESTQEILKSAFWLMYFCNHMELPKDILDECIPPGLLAALQV
ncbi:PREDICTED: WASH complex subunit strumpellin homolog isoform X3 [Nelumbo nucifera]|uniref:WASH complex subunit strumpellin homolog isoform X3 n=1 Tax=Nelumbo nucifera TaxID=4432 RepID=A0A1U8Q0I9_NELNU|nr:PREDICTED: WASH complex subunit strumpellin homolog isoform X3 [Nelumbo nucifera]